MLVSKVALDNFGLEPAILDALGGHIDGYFELLVVV